MNFTPEELETIKDLIICEIRYLIVLPVLDEGTKHHLQFLNGIANKINGDRQAA